MVHELAAAIIAVIALALLLGSFVVLYAQVLPTTSWTRIVAQSLGCAAPGVAVWLLFAPIFATDLRSAMLPPLALLGAVCSYLVTLIARATGASFRRTMVFGSAWSVCVFLPTAMRTFEPFGASSPLGLNPIDHGGALVMSVAVGSALLAVLVVERRVLIRGSRMTVPRSLGAIALVALMLAWLAWLVGAEFAIDELAGLIVLNGVVSAIGGVVGWGSVQLISHSAVTFTSLVGGLVSGLVAVTAGAPLFTPVSAAVAGVLAGAVASALTMRRGSPLGNQLRFLVNAHLAAGSVGVLSLGILATDAGFLFTGQTGILQEQLLSLIATASWSFAVSLGTWWLLGAGMGAWRARALVK